jgi:hypothetical protein
MERLEGKVKDAKIDSEDGGFERMKEEGGRMERLKRGYGRLERLEREVEGWKDWRGGRWMFGRLEGRLGEGIH